MQMTFRWFGKDLDTVSLEQIKQIPGVVGVVPALHYLPAGEAWEMEDVQKMYDEITAAGLTMECIESVNVHEDIKLGLPTRDKLIENYKKSIRNLAKVGVKVICYNFMPVFDWTRTDLYMPLPDGSTCLSYDGKQVEGKSPEDMFKEIDDNSNGYAMPGWETERMGEIKELFAKYKTIEDFANADVADIEEIIRPCGLYKTKARSIVAMCRQIMDNFGGEIPDTIEKLTTLAGIGRKTANLVMGDVFHKPAVVTDTHCIRICGRLGLTKNKEPAKVEEDLRKILPPERSSDFCHRLVLFGREYCKARGERCSECPLLDICGSRK